MFSDNFHQVYKEAFLSGTGREFETSAVQEEHDAYVPPVEEALLEHWTNPDIDLSESISDEKSVRGGGLFRMRHPKSAEFNEEDARDIAHVRFLGHAIINTAALHAPSPNDADGLPLAFQGLNYSQWYYAHNSEDIPDDRSYDPDCPSPLRLASWPSGEYVNCLGISIAVAGQHQRETDTPFFYVNRLRDADYESSMRFVRAFTILKKRCPDIIPNLGAMFTVAGMNYDRATKHVESYSNTTEHIGEVKVDDSFHHAILSQTGDIFGQWAQVDPYALVQSAISPVGLDNSLDSFLQETTVGRANEIIVVDSDMVDRGYKEVDSIIRAMPEMSKGLLEAAAGNIKSSKYLDNVREKFLELFDMTWLRRHVEDSVSSAELTAFSRRNKHLGDETASKYWLLFMLGLRGVFYKKHDTTAIGNFEDADDFTLDMTAKIFTRSGALRRFKDIEEINGLIKILEDSISNDLPYNARMQKYFKGSIGIFPSIFCMNELFRQRDHMSTGLSDQAMEVGDPAFMIGAAYLNHYATWRKDGKVNVAKELARLTPSQIIWQAAVAREPDISDERVRSVGKLIKGLKNDQLHPYVRITLPTIKE